MQPQVYQEPPSQHIHPGMDGEGGKGGQKVMVKKKAWKRSVKKGTRTKEKVMKRMMREEAGDGEVAQSL